jgi:hypothetical protein
MNEASVSRLVGHSVIACAPLAGGRNSRVSVAYCDDGTTFIVKEYAEPTPEGRDRLAAEYDALEWLAGHGETCTPRPVACDASERIAIYEHIVGEPADTVPITAEDVDQAVAFLIRLDRMKSERDASRLPCAAEACFSFPEIVDGIRGRFAAICATDASLPVEIEARRFLLERFLPRLDAVVDSSLGLLADCPWLTEPIPKSDWVLSPSDFGFHNAIRRTDGRLAFVDFEYFGWDDPAKTIADFVLHPAMHLDFALTKRFVESFCGALAGRAMLARRLPVAYALFGLKWCMILLNEFIPEQRARRRFSGEARSEDDLLRGQLAKAEAMLDHVEDAFPGFPYHD